MIWALFLNLLLRADTTSKIEMEWDPVPLSVGYEIELKDDKGKVIKLKTEKNVLSEDVPIGLYKVRIRSIRKDLKNGKWSPAMSVDVMPLDLIVEEPLNEARLIAPSEKGALVKFRWKAREGLKKFYFRLWSAAGEVKTQSLDKKEIDIELKPGITYYWLVTARSEDGVVYDNSDQAMSFIIIGDRLPPPFEIDLENSLWSWTPVEKAKTYQVQIYYRYLEESDWTLFHEERIKNQKILFDFLPPREYKIRVVSESPYRLSSLPAERQFFVKPKSTSSLFP